MKDKILAACYDFMIGGGMIFAGSIAITIAISIPFVAFGSLHTMFCK
jgi:hypothetical protein